MDNRLKRFLSLALAIIMVIGMMPTNVVFATEGASDDSQEIVEDNTTLPSETEHQCTFVETARVEPDWATAGSVTLACACGEEKTERLCATGCWMDSHHEGDCEILCDKDRTCVLDYGHEGLCVSMDGLVLVSNISTAEQLKNALAATASGEITLAADIAVTETLEIPANIQAVLNLNGKKITVTAAEGKTAPAYALKNLGKLTVKGTGEVWGIQNGANDSTGAELVIENGTFKANGANDYAVFNYGEATVKDGTFEAAGGYALRNYNSAVMTVEKVTAAQGVHNAGTLTITTGKFTSVAGSHAVHSYGGRLIVDGGEFDNNADTLATVKIDHNGVAIINGGSIDIEADSLALEVAATASVTVNGDNVNGGISVAQGAALTINGGSYQDPGDDDYDVAGTVVVNGGTYTDVNSKAFAAQFAAAGKVIKFDAAEMVKSGENAVSPVIAKIGTGDALVAYPSLELAVAAATNGATVKVVADWTLNEAIAVTGSKSITIEADKAVTITNAQIDAFQASNGATLTLGSNLKIESTNSVLWAKAGGDIIVDGAEITVTDSSNCAACATGTDSSITVLSGVINQKSNNAVTLVAKENAVVTVSGGTVQSESSSAIAAKSSAVVNISGGTVKTVCEDPAFCAVYACDKGKINISGGTVSAATGLGAVACANGEVNISDGEIIGGVKAHEDALAKVIITGGTIGGNVSAEDGASVVISGGTFAIDPADIYIKENYESIETPISGTTVYVVHLKKVDIERPTGTVLDTLVDNLGTPVTVDEVLSDIESNENINKDVVNDTGYRLVIMPVKVITETGDPYKTSVITYEVSPVKLNGEKVSNPGAEITFNLPIPGSKPDYVDYANVYHEGEHMGVFEIKGSAENWYVTVKSATFSKFTVELIDVDGDNHVAKIGVKGYPSVQAAVNAVQDGQTIELMDLPINCSYGNVEISLNANKKFTIDGGNKTWADAHITVSGGAATEQTAPMVTIKNINFTAVNTTEAEFIKISGNQNYNNVLIENCNFTGSGKDKSMVAIRLNNANGVTVKGGTASGLQAFLNNTAGKNLTVEGVTINESNVGMELGAVQGVTVKNVTITSTVGRYGISLDASVNNKAVFDGCTVKAAVPVMVYNTTVLGGHITFQGVNTLGTAESKYWIVLSDERYSGMASDTDVEKLTTTGRIVITVKDAGLSAEGINDKYLVAHDGYTKYYTVKPAGVLKDSMVFVLDDGSQISCDVEKLVASESVEIWVYDKDGKLLAVTGLSKPNTVLFDTDLSVSVEISRNSSTWDTVWKTDEKCPTYKNIPATAKLIVDDTVMGEVPVEMYRTDFPEEKRVWTDVPGVGNLTVTEDEKVTWHHTLAEAFAAVKKNGTVTLYEDNDIVLSAAGEITGGKTVTVTGKATFDWTKGWLYVGRGENSGNGTLIFNNAKIKAAGTGNDTGIHVSGAQKNAANKNYGTLELVNGSEVELDYLVSRNIVRVDNSKLTVKHGFYVHGRPESETPDGADAMALMEVTNGSTLTVLNAVNAILGEESYGELIVNNSTFICNCKLQITEETASQLNVSGTSTLKLKEVAGNAVNLVAEAVLKDSTIGGKAIAQGTVEKPSVITLTGKNTINELTLEHCEANIDIESSLTADNISMETDEKIIIDATNLGKEPVKVIYLTEDANDATKSLMKTAKVVVNNNAAKRIDADGGVSVYFEAYLDADNDNVLDAGEGYATIEAAIAAATDGQTVVLLADAEVSALVEVSKKITLDLGGKTLSGDTLLGITADGVTVKNGKLDATVCAVMVVGDAKFILSENAEIKAKGADDAAAVGIALCNAGEAVVESGKVSGDVAILVFGGKLNVTGGTVDGGQNVAIATVCYDEEISAVTDVSVSGGEIIGGIYVTEDEDMPEGYKATVSITGGNFTNSDMLAMGETNKIVVSGGTFDAWVDVAYCKDGYICQEKADTELYEVVPAAGCRIYLSEAAEADMFHVGDTVYFDGEDYEVLPGKVVVLDNEVAKKPAMFVTTYSYETKGTDDAMDDYPEEMYVWFAEGTDADNDGICDSYKITRVGALDNFFVYEGTSIRVGGSDNGIRFFSSVDAANTSKLINGKLITEGTAQGAKLTEAGTQFWKREDNKLSSQVYGGAVGNSFRVFAKVEDRNWFTGVLVGLDTDGETTVASIYSRPYANIQIGENTVALYGGILDRSIYYVAMQNKDVFTEGSSYDNFVEGLIKTGEDFLATIRED